MGRSALCIALSALHVHGIDQLCGTTMSTTCTIAKRKIIDRASNDGSVRAVRFKTSSSLRLFECGKGEGGFFPPRTQIALGCVVLACSILVWCCAQVAWCRAKFPFGNGFPSVPCGANVGKGGFCTECPFAGSI